MSNHVTHDENVICLCYRLFAKVLTKWHEIIILQTHKAVLLSLNIDKWADATQRYYDAECYYVCCHWIQSQSFMFICIIRFSMMRDYVSIMFPHIKRMIVFCDSIDLCSPLISRLRFYWIYRNSNAFGYRLALECSIYIWKIKKKKWLNIKNPIHISLIINSKWSQFPLNSFLFHLPSTKS